MSNNNSVIAELRKDFEDASWLTGKEKKALAAKYGTSIKCKDIQTAVLLKLQELRKNKIEFDENDITDFNRLTDTDTKMFDALAVENTEFVKYLREYYANIMKGRKDIFRWVNLTSFSGLSFSPYEKRLIKIYQKLTAVIEGRDPEKIKAVAKETASIEDLTSKLTSELADFKVEYLKRVEKHAASSYTELPTVIESLTNYLQVLRKNYEDKRKETKNYYVTWPLYQKVEKQEREISRKKAILKMYPTKESFIEVCLKDAELTFRGNVDALAHRVYDKEFDVENIKITNVKDDPKIFQLMIDDGTKKLFCRSILAAQFSDKMVPHFRFIMTDRK